MEFETKIREFSELSNSQKEAINKLESIENQGWYLTFMALSELGSRAYDSDISKWIEEVAFYVDKKNEEANND